MKQNRKLPEMLERKIAMSRFSLFFERIWPKAWIILGAILAFVVFSMFGIWALLPAILHKALLGLLVLTAVAGAAFAAWTPYPTRDEAIRRIEATSQVLHRPATTANDELDPNTSDQAGQAIWAEHQRRMAAEAERLRAATAKPRTDRYDPFALRAAAILLVALGVGLAGNGAGDRLYAAFDFGQQAAQASRARLDAWITPPPYTARPAIILADGGRRGGAAKKIAAPGLTDDLVSAPEGSTITVRTSGSNADALVIQTYGADGKLIADSAELAKAAAEKARAEKEATAARAKEKTQEENGRLANGAAAQTKPTGGAPADGLSVGRRKPGILDAKLTLDRRTTKIVAMLDGSRARAWDIKIIPDLAPTIEQNKAHEVTRRGGMKLFYQIKDDFGIASAEARFVALPPDEEDPRTQWARPEELKGPRLPLSRPPKVSLRIPARNSKDGKTWTFADIGSHPWAGMRVRMTLIATDHAGNVGQSKPFEMRLPERQFVNPLARAVIEQRRNLVVDDRYRDLVRKALAALTLEPEGFIKDLGVYTGLRSAYYRLDRDKTKPGLDTTIEQLWHLALRIEDGRGLSAAERRLRELQRQLSQAIENGASDEEIQRLMRELRQALAEFMNQLAREGQQVPQQGQNQQTLSQQDLDRMLRDLENMARQGSRDQAQEMLSQLQDLIDRMQSGRMAQRGQQGQQSREMMEMLNRYGEIIGQQQRLMDETHGAQRQPGQQGQQQGQRGQQGQGQRGQGQRGQGQRGQAQRGQQGGRGRGQQPGGQGQGSLSDRQADIGQMLDELQRRMEGNGLRGGENMEGARDSMEAARRALREGDLGRATQEQARALEQLRQGAQSMAQQLRSRMPSRFGRAGDAPLDPLGRPQRSDGPDNGSTVKVPGEIETQRAREILEELRRRLGQPQRPEPELDYIERLLERF